jgi:beta-phosphoglucomutase-like phosphatase (HAD superfamily)
MDYTTSQLIKEAVAQYDSEVREAQYDNFAVQRREWKDYDAINEGRRRQASYDRLSRCSRSRRVHDYDAEQDAAQARRKALEKAKHDPIWGINGRVSRLKERRRASVSTAS